MGIEMMRITLAPKRFLEREIFESSVEGQPSCIIERDGTTGSTIELLASHALETASRQRKKIVTFRANTSPDGVVPTYAGPFPPLATRSTYESTPFASTLTLLIEPGQFSSAALGSKGQR
jgi:hypothetical protein